MSEYGLELIQHDLCFNFSVSVKLATFLEVWHTETVLTLIYFTYFQNRRGLLSSNDFVTKLLMYFHLILILFCSLLVSFFDVHHVFLLDSALQSVSHRRLVLVLCIVLTGMRVAMDMEVQCSSTDELVYVLRKSASNYIVSLPA